MLAILCIAAVIAAVTLYDYLNTRSWQQVTSSTRNETVFNTRNKAYGAYVMRRDYNRNLILIMGGMLGGLGVLYAATHSNDEITMVAEKPIMTEIEYDLNLEKKPEPEVEKQQSAPAVKPPLAVQLQVPVVVDGPIVEPIVLPTENPGDGTPDGEGDATSVIPSGGGTGGTDIKEEPPVVIPPAEPELFPDVPAEFPGGKPALKNYLEKELRFPEMADDVDGNCYLQFIVSETGAISQVVVQRGIEGCEACDKEAVRVIKRMPFWKPARSNNRPVKSYFNIPIRFVAH